MTRPLPPSPPLRRGDAALARALDLYVAILQTPGGASVRDCAANLGIPLSTARRMVATFVRKGLLIPSGRGQVEAISPVAQGLHQRLVQAGRLPIRRLSLALRKTIHFGVLESGMVTYILKEDGGDTPLFTRPDNQLEAYCSALGKLLLAHLPEHQQEAYLAEGPFIALTPNTITDPGMLRESFRQTRLRGYALDDGEVADGLRCVAIPVRGGGGHVLAALSCSQMAAPLSDRETAQLIEELSACAASVSRRVDPLVRPGPPNSIEMQPSGST